jgi:hypothetical protein
MDRQNIINSNNALLDSVDDGGIDLADAVVAALVEDGVPYEMASSARNAIALAYQIRQRSREDALVEVGAN